MSYQKTEIHTEKRASNEIGDPSTMQPEEPAGGFLDTLKEGLMSGVETVRSGVNYLADQVTGAAADEQHKVEEKTIVKDGPNAEVEKRTKIVENQTRYPNQTGYGVNPKFKEDKEKGALDDIKSGLKKGAENIKEGVKDFKEDVKAGAKELKNNVKEGWEDVKIEANRVANNPPDTYAERARRFENKAEDLLEERDKDLREARKAQAKADKKACEANAKTAKALHKQELGQEYLASAGAEMQMAGAQMQNAACTTGVREETCVKSVNKTPGGKTVHTETHRKVC